MNTKYIFFSACFLFFSLTSAATPEQVIAAIEQGRTDDVKTLLIGRSAHRTIQLAMQQKKFAVIEYFLSQPHYNSEFYIKNILMEAAKSKDLNWIMSVLGLIKTIPAKFQGEIEAILKLAVKSGDINFVKAVMQKIPQPELSSSQPQTNALAFLLEYDQGDTAENILRKGLRAAPDQKWVFQLLLQAALMDNFAKAFKRTFFFAREFGVVEQLSKDEWKPLVIEGINSGNKEIFNAIFTNPPQAVLDSLDSSIFANVLLHDPEWILDILKAGMDPNKISFLGYPFVVTLGFLDKLDLIKNIINTYRDKLDVLKSDSTIAAIQFLLKTQKWDAAQLFIDEGANPNSAEFDAHPALFIAVQFDKKEIARNLIEKGADVNAASLQGVTPLMALAQRGDLDLMRLAIAKGAILETKTPDSKMTALAFAAREGQVDAMKLLIKKGARLDTLDVDENSLLHHACQGGHVPAIEYLLSLNFRDDVHNKFGVTPFATAVKSSKLEAIGFLLRLLNDDVVTRKDKFESAWVLAANFDLLAVAEFLSTSSGFSHDEVLRGKKMAWFAAAKSSSERMIEWLLAHGIAVDELTDDGSQKTALMLAAQDGNLKAISLLIKHGANLELTDSDGNNAMELAKDYKVLELLRRP